MISNEAFNKYFRMRRIFSILILLSLILTGTIAHAQISLGRDTKDFDYANPKDYEIGGITVTGVRYLDQDVLVMLSGLKVGKTIKIPGDAISEAINKLWKQGLADNIKISITGKQGSVVFLNIELTERPRLSRFTFKGIKRAEADNIRSEINLTRGEVVTNYMLSRLSGIIEKHFIDKGYLNVAININQIKDTTRANTVILEFNIDKNSKVKIYEINVVGNDNVSAKKVKSALKETKDHGVFTPLENIEDLLLDIIGTALRFDFPGMMDSVSSYVTDNIKLRIFKASKFIQTDYNEDKRLLIEKYNTLGYRDAKIINDSIYKNENGTISIEIIVDEGPKYYFRDITFVGNTKYTAEFLSAILKIKKGEIYNKEALETNLSYNPMGMDVSSLYLDDGYLFFQAIPVEVMVENDSIDIEIRIREGEQSTIKKVSGAPRRTTRA